MANFTYYICDRDGNLKHEVQADTHAYQGTILELQEKCGIERLFVTAYKEWGSFWRERNDES